MENISEDIVVVCSSFLQCISGLHKGNSEEQFFKRYISTCGKVWRGIQNRIHKGNHEAFRIVGTKTAWQGYFEPHPYDE